MGGFAGADMGEIPDDLLQQRLSTQMMQPEVDPIQAYKQSQEQFGIAQQMAQARQQDLDLSGRMIKLLDPQVPKPAREFLYKELSRSMGADPKGQTSAEIGKMLLSMDPGSLDNLRRNFAEQLPNAKPGEINAKIQAILQGKVSGMQLMDLAAAKGPAQPPAEGGAPAGAVAGSGVDTPEVPKAPVAPATPRQPTSITGKPEVPVVSERIKGEGSTPEIAQPVDPRLLKHMRFDPNIETRLKDVTKEGFTPPRSAKDQKELADQLDANNANATTSALESAKLYSLFKGRPEVLGIVGAGVRGIDQLVDTGRGAIRALGIDDSEVDLGNKTTVGALKNAADNVMSWYDKSRLQAMGVDSARVQSATINMAYSMAAARGLSGRLTNGMLNQILGEIGTHSSAAQFEGTLKDTLQRSVDRAQNDMKTKLGKASEGAIDVDTLNPQQLQTIASARDIMPKAVVEAVASRMEALGRGETGPTYKPLTLQSPTLAEERQTLAQDAAQEREHKAATEARAQQTADLAVTREQRATEHEKFQRDQATLKEFQEQRRYDLAMRKEARAEAHQRRQEITAAFLRLGASIAAAGGHQAAIGGGTGGGDQDSGAFKINPGVGGRRQAPQPIDASRYQRGK